MQPLCWQCARLMRLKTLWFNTLCFLLLGIGPAFALNLGTGYDSGAFPASEVTTDCSKFSGNLSCNDRNVQHALETIDQLIVGAGGTIDAADVTFNNTTYPTVEAALNALLYNAPTITTFTNNKNNLENGTSVTSTILNWTISGTITSQSLNQSIGSLSTALRTYTHTSTYSTNRTYTLTASDGVTTVQKSTSVTFLNSNYYGVNASPSLDDSGINNLSHDLSSTKVATRTGLTPAAQYLYIVYPATYGTATFLVNGLLNNDWTLFVQSHTNASGASVSYNVYRSNNILTGTYSVEVQ